VVNISESYSDVPVGEVLCMFNTSGYLEIAINLGKASSLLNLKKDETIHIDFYN
jgi:S-adenosylmethionine hydrolase